MEPMKVYVEISETISGKIEFRELPFVKKDVVKGLDGSSYSRKLDTFTIPLTWQSCLALRSTFGSDLVIGPELLKWATDLRKTQIDPAMYWRGVLEGPCETELDEMLFPHQRADVRFVAATGAALICNGLGSGKTFSALASLRHLHEQGEEVFPVLVACPNAVKTNWLREISRIWPDTPVHVYAGSTPTAKAKVLKAFEDEGGFLVVNWEALPTLSSLVGYGSTALKVCVECGGLDPKVTVRACEKHSKFLNTVDFRSIIGDELHRIKSPSAKMTRAFKRASQGSKFRIGLTGTPIANDPSDLWSLMNWLLPQSFPSMVKYRDRFLEQSYDQWGYSTIVGLKSGAEAEFYAAINPYLRRVSKQEVLPFLPPVVRETRRVELPNNTKQGRAYKEMVASSIAELDGGVVTAASALAITHRLMQFSMAFGTLTVTPYTGVDEDGNEFETFQQSVQLTDPSVILDEFVSGIDDFGDEQVVVFSPYKDIIELLTARLTKAGKTWGRYHGDVSEEEREFHLKNFQEGRTQFFCATTGSGGTGLNLQNARICVFLGRPYSKIESDQCEGRIHRIGSEKFDNVLIIDYTVADTVQERVFEILDKKGEHLETILQDKERFKRLLTNSETSGG